MTRGARGIAGDVAAVWGLVVSADRASGLDPCWSIPDAPLGDSALAAVVTTSEPQVCGGGEVYTARVHGSRAVGGLLVPPVTGRGGWR